MNAYTHIEVEVGFAPDTSARVARGEAENKVS